MDGSSLLILESITKARESDTIKEASKNYQHYFIYLHSSPLEMLQLLLLFFLKFLSYKKKEKKNFK